MSQYSVPLVIPAYNPPATLPHLIMQLHDSGFAEIVVVDDGSSPSHQSIFSEIDAHGLAKVLRNATNLGKGAALKHGLNYCYCHFQNMIGVVTVDADGQHLPEDAKKVAQKLQTDSNALVLGVRQFEKNDIPWRSRFGNTFIRTLFKILVGTSLQDTQTGLRGIPRDLIPDLLRISSSSYEFEIDMLLTCRQTGRSFAQVPISTIYIDENRTSHFNPLLDSMKIIFVLLRFTLVSLSTALIDYSIFFLTFAFGFNLISCQVSARLVAMAFNYTVVKRWVFASREQHLQTFPKYLALVVFSGFVSFQMITVFMQVSFFNVLSAKILSELLIFVFNFAIQRDFIFHRRSSQTQTDWTSYYEKPYRTAGLTRRFTSRLLQLMIRRYHPEGAFTIAELGGANSCFVDGIIARFAPKSYHVYDNNHEGLNKLSQRIAASEQLSIHEINILAMGADRQFDMVFSVGLIEHFTPEETRQVISAHFALLKPNGIAIFFYPTPTVMYRVVRKASELLGLWIFHDERPLKLHEVLPTVLDHGELLEARLNMMVVLTQQILVVRKKDVMSAV